MSKIMEGNVKVEEDCWMEDESATGQEDLGDSNQTEDKSKSKRDPPSTYSVNPKKETVIQKTVEVETDGHTIFRLKRESVVDQIMEIIKDRLLAKIKNQLVSCLGGDESVNQLMRMDAEKIVELKMEGQVILQLGFDAQAPSTADVFNDGCKASSGKEVLDHPENDNQHAGYVVEVQHNMAPTYSQHTSDHKTQVVQQKGKKVTVSSRSELHNHHTESPSQLQDTKLQESTTTTTTTSTTDLGIKGKKCSLCQETFPDWESLLQHNQSAHFVNNFYQCSVCKAFIKKKPQLKVHMRLHTGHKPYECLTCGESFYSSSTLSTHRNFHSKIYQCSICDKVCSSRARLKEHTAAHTKKRSSPRVKSYRQGSRTSQRRKAQTESKNITSRKAFVCHTHGLSFSCAESLLEHKRKFRFECEHAAGYDSSTSNEQFFEDQMRHQDDAGDSTPLSQHQALTKDSQDRELDTGTVTREVNVIASSELHVISRHTEVVNTTEVAPASTSEHSECSLKTHTAHEDMNQHENMKFEENLTCSLCQKVFSDHENLYEHNITAHHLNDSYQCSVCEKSIKSKYQLKLHMNIHQGEKPYVCSICGLSFYSSSSLNAHKHRHSKLFECALCHKVLPSSAHLNSHMRSHTGEKPYQCIVCQKEFQTSSKLNVHARTHSRERPFPCSICGKTYSTSSDVRRHEKIHTGDVEEIETCPICGQEFSLKKSFEEHMKIHKGANPFQCSLCDKAYSGPRGLADHYRVLHRIKTLHRDRLYQCIICNEEIQHGSPLQSHSLVHSTDTVLHCSYCDKTYQSAARLKEHEKRHLIEKPEPKTCQCPVCGKAFTRKAYLATHMRIHTGEKPYKCPICGKGFAQKCVLPYHIRRHTGERPHQCSTCNKSFCTKEAMVRHARRHTGEKTFMCSVCGKGFVEYNGMKKHEQIHTGIKPYACSVCGKAYSSRQNLRIHSKIHEAASS